MNFILIIPASFLKKFIQPPANSYGSRNGSAFVPQGQKLNDKDIRRDRQVE